MLASHDLGQPILKRRTHPAPGHVARTRIASDLVGLSQVYIAEGSIEMTNEHLVSSFPGRTAEEIYRLTGIRSGRYVSKSETVLNLASCRGAPRPRPTEPWPRRHRREFLLHLHPHGRHPFAGVSSPKSLGGSTTAREVRAYDLFAACSGYLYALSAAFEFLESRPQAKALVVTAEAMSQVVNPADFDTAVLFGDSASATIVCGADGLTGSWAALHRPFVAARADQEEILSVPIPGSGLVTHQGKRVFAEAVRTMIFALERACIQSNIALQDLDFIVPHQANGRIIEAIRTRLNFPPERIISTLSEHGNTSSSTIPICLSKLASSLTGAAKVGLCAFGGGFTFGAAILQVNPHRASPGGDKPDPCSAK